MTDGILFCAPGYLIAAGYALSAVMFSTRNPARLEQWKRILIWIALVVFNILIAIVTDLGIEALVIPVQLAVLGVSYTILILTCRISKKNAAFFTLCSLLIGELMASLSYQCYLYLFHVRDIFQHEVLWLVLCFAVVSGILFLGLFHYERKYFIYNQRHQVSSQELFSALFIVFFFYFLSNCGYSVFGTGGDIFEQKLTEQELLQINLIRALMDFAGVFLLESVRTIQVQNDKLSGVERMERLMKQQQANFRVSEQSIALVNQKYHDLKHQIALLREQATNPAQINWFDRMEEEIRSFEAQVNTNNYVLDIILTAKMLECQKKGIQMTCSMDGKLLDFMDQMELCAMMGNLLDNAVEGVEKLPDPEKRWIQVSLRRKNNFSVLEVGNWYNGDVDFQEGLPQTTKKDKNFHGFGTQSVRQIVKHYGGTVSFSTEDNWFKAKIIFVESV